MSDRLHRGQTGLHEAAQEIDPLRGLGVLQVVHVVPALPAVGEVACVHGRELTGHKVRDRAEGRRNLCCAGGTQLGGVLRNDLANEGREAAPAVPEDVELNVERLIGILPQELVSPVPPVDDILDLTKDEM